MWQQHFNLSCNFARSPCHMPHELHPVSCPFICPSALLMVYGIHWALGCLQRGIHKAVFHIIFMSPSTFDFISYFLLNLCSGGRITRKIIFISSNLNTFSIMEKNQIFALPANPFIATRPRQAPIRSELRCKGGFHWLFIIPLWPCSRGTY